MGWFNLIPISWVGYIMTGFMIANLEGGQKASLAPRKKKELDDHTGLNWCLGGSSKIVGHWIFEVGTEIEEHFFWQISWNFMKSTHDFQFGEPQSFGYTLTKSYSFPRLIISILAGYTFEETRKCNSGRIYSSPQGRYFNNFILPCL